MRNISQSRTLALVMASAITVALVVGQVACKRSNDGKTPEEIFNTEASGVAIVVNSVFYKASLPNGINFYFSGIENGELKDLTTNLDSIKLSTVSGTAFFVDDQGSLLTNRHVVYPELPHDQVVACVNKSTARLMMFYQHRSTELAQIMAVTQQEIENNVYWDFDILGRNFTHESPDNDSLRVKLEALGTEKTRVEQALETLSYVNPSEISVQVKTNISIALHNQRVTTANDFMQCKTVMMSPEESVDLALIRLKNEHTPEECHIFKTPQKNDEWDSPTLAEREKLSITQPLVMIGYNQGLMLGTTEQGIQAQLTTGTISQEPDNQRVMYSIAALQGSSGSPVLNQWGELVAVNYAGILNSQSFNFGIPLVQINKYLKDWGVIKPVRKKMG